MKKLGFIGLGMMGLPMVENLARVDGLQIQVFDQRAEQMAALQGNAAWGKSLRGAASLADLADCDAVLTMLPNSAITSQVLESLATQLRAGALVIDMGSSNPTETTRMGAVLAQAGVDLVDAPVSGAVVKARSGTLAIMVGGQPDAVARALPVLQKMGSTVIPTGALASAHAMKALNNYVYAAGLLAASEALLIADRLGLDKNVFAEVLNASSGKNVATQTKLQQFIIPGTFDGGFALRLQAKDLATADALRSATGVRAPQLAHCAALWEEASHVLEADADNTRVYRFLDRQSTSPSPLTHKETA